MRHQQQQQDVVAERASMSTLAASTSAFERLADAVGVVDLD